jgi:hypothetical protein
MAWSFSDIQYRGLDVALMGCDDDLARCKRLAPYLSPSHLLFHTPTSLLHRNNDISRLSSLHFEAMLIEFGCLCLMSANCVSHAMEECKRALTPILILTQQEPPLSLPACYNTRHILLRD